MSDPRIKTYHYDGLWCAFRDPKSHNDKRQDVLGYGSTEEEAIAKLREGFPEFFPSPQPPQPGREWWIVDTKEPGTVNSLFCPECGFSNSEEAAHGIAKRAHHHAYSLVHVREVPAPSDSQPTTNLVAISSKLVDAPSQPQVSDEAMEWLKRECIRYPYASPLHEILALLSARKEGTPLSPKQEGARDE